MIMDKNKKIILGVVGVATLGLVFLFYKKATAQASNGTTLLKSDVTPTQPQTTQEEINTQAPDIADMPGEPTPPAAVDLPGLVQPPTILDLSNILYDSFKGYGTTWKNGQFGGVYGVFSQLKSDDDFDELNTAFGIRKIDSGLLNLFKKDYTGDMNSVMNDELTKNEISKINTLLEKNGLSRRISIM